MIYPIQTDVKDSDPFGETKDPDLGCVRKLKKSVVNIIFHCLGLFLSLTLNNWLLERGRPAFKTKTCSMPFFALKNRIRIQEPTPINADSVRETDIFCQGASVQAPATVDCDFLVRYTFH